MIVDLIEVAATGGFAAYAFYRSGAFDGLIAEIRRGTSLTPPPLPKAKPTLADAFERYSLQADHEERQKLLASPTGWLLDPFRYPTNPHEGREIPAWRGAIDARMELKSRMARMDMGLEPMYVGPAMLRPEASFRMVMADPPCPACGSAHTEASATHGSSTSMWWCRECTAEFTLDGETKKSKKSRKSLPPLPCGHVGGMHKEPRSPGSFMVSVCDKCSAEWWPRSDDPSGRSLAQGEIGFYRNGKMHSGQEDVPFDLPLPPANRD